MAGRRKRGLSIISLLFVLCWIVISSSEPILMVSDAEPSCDPRSSILNMQQKNAYQRDGFILMKNVLSEDLVERLSKAGIGVAEIGQKFPAYFSVVERGVMFDSGLQSLNSEATKAFRETSLYSTIPQIAAELMQLDGRSQNLRVLR